MLFIFNLVRSFVASCLNRVRRNPDLPYGVHTLEIPDDDLQKMLFISDIMDLEEDGHITPRVSEFIIDLFNERMNK
tara:strand:- start:359 stop:586 length:228 start_codon:yes stop_codon:yes gene_type:complete